MEKTLLVKEIEEKYGLTVLGVIPEVTKEY